jgi:hypothetical protein
MQNDEKERKTTRRDLLKAGGLIAGLESINGAGFAQEAPKAAATVRDRLWLWGHYEGSHNKGWNLPGNSRITPVEAAYYLSIPNIVMVRYEGKPEIPCDQYAVPFRALREVVWSVVGAGGTTAASERETVLKMAERNKNFTGVIMDDFFTDKKQGQIAALGLEDLKTLRTRLDSGSKRLDLWVTLYTRQLDDPIADYLKYCDVLTLWTWKGAEIDQLASKFELATQLSPRSRKVLGCYMWDYGDKKPMPVAAMQQQCEMGLKWLREGKIEGIIFLASCICDLNLETVEWTRRWITKVANEKLPVRKKTPA